jgi:hypothetical protein
MKRSTIAALALLFLVVILTGCATAAHQNQPLDIALRHAPAPSGLESMPPMPHDPVVGADVPTDLPPVAQQAESGLVSLATAHLKRASELAANGGDAPGKQCWDTSLSLLSMLSIGLGHEDGIAPVIEKGRLLAKTLKGPMVEQWEVDCAPVYVQARLDALEFARKVFGDVIAAKVGLPIVGAVKGMLP